MLQRQTAARATPSGRDSASRGGTAGNPAIATLTVLGGALWRQQHRAAAAAGSAAPLFAFNPELLASANFCQAPRACVCADWPKHRLRAPKCERELPLTQESVRHAFLLHHAGDGRRAPRLNTSRTQPVISGAESRSPLRKGSSGVSTKSTCRRGGAQPQALARPAEANRAAPQTRRHPKRLLTARRCLRSRYTCIILRSVARWVRAPTSQSCSTASSQRVAVFIIVVASHPLALVMITAEHQYDDNGTQSQRCTLATPKTALTKRASGSSTCV
jgi:hypothetical protein